MSCCTKKDEELLMYEARNIPTQNEDDSIDITPKKMPNAMYRKITQMLDAKTVENEKGEINIKGVIKVQAFIRKVIARLSVKDQIEIRDSYRMHARYFTRQE